MDRIYERQRDLEIKTPPLLVIGVGGIGSWVAFLGGLSGVPKMVLVDPDRVELSNLNRTPYLLKHVGRFKVDALFELLYERCNILRFPVRIEEVDEELVNSFLGADYFTIDCRDDITSLPKWVKPPVVVGGYDGDKFSLMTPQDTYFRTFGEVRYTITPSWVAPPILVALLILLPIWKSVPPKLGTYDITQFLGGKHEKEN